MSCNCKNSTNSKGQFNCQCDSFSFPPDLKIDAGLNELPRQIATFVEYRRAMLFAIRKRTPLNFWTAREKDDLGVMLLEMWAYVCDAVSFYDKVIAQETYMRTADLRPSLRRLVALLGYLPRPAVAATVQLVALANGRSPVTIPAGLAFRSGGFDGNLPQVFESDYPVTIHPLTNRLIIKPPVSSALKSSDYLVVNRVQANIRPGALLLLIDTNSMNAGQVVKVKNTLSYVAADRQNYTKVFFESPLSGVTNIDALKLMAPSYSAALWTITGTALQGPTLNTLALDNKYNHIGINDYFVIGSTSATGWYKVKSLQDAQRPASSGVSNYVMRGTNFTMPPVPVIVTEITLDVPINTASRRTPGSPGWTDADKNTMKAYFGFSVAATIVNEPETTLQLTDHMFLDGQIEQPVDGHVVNHFILQDKNLKAVALKGSLDYTDDKINPDGSNQAWPSALTIPVSAFGNVLTASRGESVKNEILGSGNGSLVNQVFRLKKKPLTYLFSPASSNGQGIRNTLLVYVNGIKWREVPNFYGKQPVDEVYIVRQNDEGETLVIFGDGIRGKRLPSGIDNLIAHYRFGAGAITPPAGSINQIGKPIAGLSAIENPIAASGGTDREAVEELRANAPKSALLLGRAVSIRDMEAAALSVPGVRAVQSEWRWVAGKQRSMAAIWFIGTPGIAENVLQYLYNLTDPSTPIAVEQAVADQVALEIAIEIDAKYAESMVQAEVRSYLLSPVSGLLSAERYGIGKPFFRSRVFENVLSVPGVVSVTRINWNTALFDEIAKKPQAGHYFDFSLTILATG